MTGTSPTKNIVVDIAAACGEHADCLAQHALLGTVYFCPLQSPMGDLCVSILHMRQNLRLKQLPQGIHLGPCHGQSHHLV